MREDKKLLPGAVMVTASVMWWIMKEYPRTQGDALIDVMTLGVLLCAAIYFALPLITELQRAIGHGLHHFFPRFHAEWERAKGERKERDDGQR